MMRHGRQDQVGIGQGEDGGVEGGGDQRDAPGQAQIGQRQVDGPLRPAAARHADVVVGRQALRGDGAFEDGVLGARQAAERCGEERLHLDVRAELLG
ncbi:hypothetical protein G6F68_017631 [Rhizopus microsporus]|nr:hypothetical protein G6F68_017631 [Rhizopus microsporus]